jgi:hypothetical protein
MSQKGDRKADRHLAERAVIVRMTADQKSRLVAATRKLEAGTPGARVSVSRWLLELGLREAERVLSK